MAGPSTVGPCLPPCQAGGLAVTLSCRQTQTGALGHADDPMGLIRQIAHATGGVMTDMAFLLGLRREQLYMYLHQRGCFEEIQALCQRLTAQRKRRTM